MSKETDRVFSLILVPASGRDSEEIITPHHPGETKVIIKSVQTLCLSPLPRVDSFLVGSLECDGAVA
ncbi:hypothetical protein MNBD_NITROSPIRAE03-253 [hydrothermal vent metagenome]|uniref:Uncharacterized protein n=1 Tax=hydrothermal vent metagenome TaxID=652676 RepID=A0A3B1DRZ5_9ZZZZ